MENNTLAKDIFALEKQLLTPETRHSLETLHMLLADNFIEFGRSGQVYDKAAIMQSLSQEETPKLLIDRFKVIRLSPKVVLATYRSIHFVAQATFPLFSLRSSIWEHRNNRW